MKNLSLVLSAVLIVAVGVLYYLQFRGDGQSEAGGSNGDVLPSDITIAYINSDSVLKYYDYFKEISSKLEEKRKTFDQDLRNRAESFQREISAYQQNANNLTPNQARATEEDLGNKQQNLQLYQQNLTQQLAQEDARMTEELYKKVTGFLQKYSEERGIHLVFQFNPASDVLYGGKALDITDDVVKGLNENYTAAADSVSTN